MIATVAYNNTVSHIGPVDNDDDGGYCSYRLVLINNSLIGPMLYRTEPYRTSL